MYSAAYDNREVRSSTQESDLDPSKVDIACDSIREAVERIDNSRFSSIHLSQSLRLKNINYHITIMIETGLAGP